MKTPAFILLAALTSAFVGVSLTTANTFQDVLSSYGTGNATTGGTYLLDGSDASVVVNSTLGALPNGSVWNITVDNGASFLFSGLTDAAWTNPSGAGAGATVSIIAQNGGVVSFKNFNHAVAGSGGIYGGVITKNGGTLSLTGVNFSNNTSTVATAGYAALGGAIYSDYGTTNLTDTSFTGNSIAHLASGQTGYGGAIYQNAGTLNLTVSDGNVSSFTGNTAQGVASSVHVTSGTFNVNTQGTGVLDMVDRMTSGKTSTFTPTNQTVAITKSGTGTWRLAGVNSFSSTSADYKTTFKVSQGTLRLYGAGEATTVSGVTATTGSLLMTGTASTFSVETGAKLVAAGANAISVAANTAANAIEFKAGSSVDLLADAQLAFTGNTTLNNGTTLTFDFGSSALNSATTALITVNGTLTLATGASFLVDLNGFASGDYQLISSTNSIVGSAIGVTTRFTSVDMDGVVFSFSADGRSLWANVSAVPEPSAYAAVAGTMAFLICASTRRRRIA